MAFTPPALAAIIERVKADVRTELQADPLRRSIEYALVRALAGQSKGLYGFLAYIAKQAFPDTADKFFFWRWAAIWGIAQKPAAPWRGVIRFTGANGTAIAAGSQLTRSDGALYQTDALGVIGGGIANIATTAVLGGASTTNTGAQPLDLSTPIAGVDSTAIRQSTTQAGTDTETQAEGLVRLLLRIQTPPSGGGQGDYTRWALEVAGVTRSWEFPLLEGANSVSVAFVRDNDGTGAAIIPDAGERAAVLAHILSVAPITVDVRVITLAALPVDVTINALALDSGPTRASILAELTDFIAREGAPGGTLNLSRIDAAISAATGEISHTLVAPVADIVATTTQIQVIGAIVYT